MTTVAPTTTAASSTTTTSPTTTTTAAATTTTTEPELEPHQGVLTLGLFGGNVTTNNYWALLGTANSIQNGAVLGQSHPTLYTISVPDFLHIPMLAAEAAPELVQEDGRWTATVPLREGYLWSDGVEVTAADFVLLQCHKRVRARRELDAADLPTGRSGDGGR